jgi:heme exporter protein CcmD
MRDYSGYILAAYGFAAVLIGFIVVKIAFDYHELKQKLARFGDAGEGR